MLLFSTLKTTSVPKRIALAPVTAGNNEGILSSHKSGRPYNEVSGSKPDNVSPFHCDMFFRLPGISGKMMADTFGSLGLLYGKKFVRGVGHIKMTVNDFHYPGINEMLMGTAAERISWRF